MTDQARRINQRILSTMDVQDRALLRPFFVHVEQQEEAGRTFNSERDLMLEFYLFHRPPGATDQQIAAEVEASIAAGHALRRQMMD